MDWSEQRLETRAIHAGDPRPRIEGALTVPIFQSTVFEHPDDGGSYHDVRYPRLNNLPNHVALGEKLASIERAEAAQVTRGRADQGPLITRATGPTRSARR